MSAQPFYIGKYRVIRPLGEGEMGEILLADHEDLQREVVIKLLKQAYADNSDIKERFIREARSASLLRHPHVVEIHDFGMHGQRPFFVMEYFPNGTLGSKFSPAQPMPWRLSLQIINQVAEAIAYSHSRKVIHRDLKPANIMFDAHGSPKILDFGIARQNANPESRQTIARLALGTPHYMAPEQIEGDAVEASDLYALGVILYELVTGIVPFSGKSETEVYHKHVYSAVPVAPLNCASIPSGVRKLILDLLEKKKERRLGDARLLMTRINAILDTKATTVRPAGETVDPADTPISRSTVVKPATGIGASRSVRPLFVPAAMLVAAMGLIAGVWFWRNGGYAKFASADKHAPLERLQSPFLPDGPPSAQGASSILVVRGAPSPPRSEVAQPRQHDKAGISDQEPAPAGASAPQEDSAAAKQSPPDLEGLFSEVQRSCDELDVDKAKTLVARMRTANTQHGLVKDASSLLSEAQDRKREVQRLDQAVARLVADSQCDSAARLSESYLSLGSTGQALRDRALAGIQRGCASRAPSDAASIPGGTFEMGDGSGRGDRNELPTVSSTVSGFYLDKREVSQREFTERLGSNPSILRGDDLPVTNVTWDQARRYCGGTGKRLPSESEWEYAAKTGGGVFPWGDEREQARAVTGADGPSPVGSRRQGRYGLYDMAGNVAEWVESGYTTNHLSPPSETEMVVRGGSYKSPLTKVRSSAREGRDKSVGYPDVGFRCAK